ncbi:hypothetical protein [Enterococcus sp. AZ072]|uniref:hypothetical protein n=1 Tax=unclassified Enterococcus TaxID=2608891 RepID=UPI003D29A98F
MVNYQTIINNFLIAYTNNDSEGMQKLLSSDVSINYSNLGSAKGIEAVLRALCFEENFDVFTVNTTGIMTYTLNDKFVEALTVHHMVADEKFNTLYPLVFGGKYVFIIDRLSNKIEEISFVLEYQAENTSYMINKWNFSTGKNNYKGLNKFSLKSYLNSLRFEMHLDNKAKDYSKILFWCLDTGEVDILREIVTKDFLIQRDKSVGEEIFSGAPDSLDQYISETRAYFDLDQNSIALKEVHLIDSGLIVEGQHLTSHRLGTKKLNSLTKYHTFFDEDVSIELTKTNDCDLRIRKVQMKKAADVHYNRVSIINY